MLRSISALTGALGGFLIGALLRPEVFGERVPFSIIFSDEQADAPFKEMMLQNLSFSVVLGAAGALLVIPMALRSVLPAMRGRDLTDVRISAPLGSRGRQARDR